MRIKKSTISAILTLVFILFVTLLKPHLPIEVQNTFFGAPTQSPRALSSARVENVVVKRVVDGDTIELTTGETLRYIGIDTPETKHPNKPVQCFGKEAYEENKKLVEGRTIKIVRDVSNIDRHNRLLRYVFVATPASPSGILLNDYLLRNGFAFATTFPPDVEYADQFVQAQNEARENNRGLWKTCQD